MTCDNHQLSLYHLKYHVGIKMNIYSNRFCDVLNHFYKINISLFKKIKNVKKNVIEKFTIYLKSNAYLSCMIISCNYIII